MSSRVVHFELPADDPDRCAQFYADAFGWKIQKWGGPTDYWLVTTGEAPEVGIDGGIGRRQHAEHDLLRDLEPGQSGPAMGNDLVFRHVRAGLQLDKSARRLAPLVIRPRDDRGKLSRRVLVERDLDFHRRDVLPAGDDDVLRAVLDLDVTVGVPHGEIAGVEPVTAEGLRGGHVDIALSSSFVHQALHGRQAAVDGMGTQTRGLRQVRAPACQAGGLERGLQIVTEASIGRDIALVPSDRRRRELADEDGRVGQDHGDQRWRGHREGHGTAVLHGAKKLVFLCAMAPGPPGPRA